MKKIALGIAITVMLVSVAEALDIIELNKVEKILKFFLLCILFVSIPMLFKKREPTMMDKFINRIKNH